MLEHFQAKGGQRRTGSTTLARGVLGSRPRRDITQKQDGSRETGTFSQVCSVYDSTETCRRLCNRIFFLERGCVPIFNAISHHDLVLLSTDRRSLYRPFRSCRAARCVPMFTVDIEIRNFSMQLPTVLHHRFQTFQRVALTGNFPAVSRQNYRGFSLINAEQSYCTGFINDEGLYTIVCRQYCRNTR